MRQRCPRHPKHLVPPANGGSGKDRLRGKNERARYFAEFLHGSGVTHVFYLPAIVLKSLAEMEDVGICRVMVQRSAGHSR